MWFAGGLALAFQGGRPEARRFFPGGRVSPGVLRLCFWLEPPEPTLPMTQPFEWLEHGPLPCCLPVLPALMRRGLAPCWRFIYKPRFSSKGKMAASPALA